MPRFTTLRASSPRRFGVALWLAFALLWQIAVGAAQAMPVAGGLFEVCSVDGPRQVDANGEPVDAGAASHHHDCCQLPTPLLPQAVAALPPWPPAPGSVAAAPESLPRAAALPSPPSRGPPAFTC
ncbi:DUF2946 family protein [Caldimonas sp. KR1-144]|uniref:DUF2946 family protein n=1 Tax=Caldimonas sp. KR1-144 TaxID=3400911 RepID=UPI003C0A486F